MNTEDVFDLLEQHQVPRGIENWNKLSDTSGLSSFGIGLTVLRKLAKKIGRNRELALALWQTDNYDAKVLSLLIDEPKKLTIEQAESQVEEVGIGLLTHVFASCDATLAKAPFAFELAQRWLQSDDVMRRRCAYGLIYELSKKNNKKYTDEFFLSVVEKIRHSLFDEPRSSRVAMGGALMGIGKRNLKLNQAALEVARELGPIDFNEEGQKCDPMNVEKHLTSDYLKAKFSS